MKRARRQRGKLSISQLGRLRRGDSVAYDEPSRFDRRARPRERALCVCLRLDARVTRGFVFFHRRAAAGANRVASYKPRLCFAERAESSEQLLFVRHKTSRFKRLQQLEPNE